MSIAKLCESLQSEEADLRSEALAQKAADRPLFHEELGAQLVKFRTDRGWSVQQAVNFSEKKHPGALTWNKLTHLERGKTKYPDADALRALADLYDLSYTTLAAPYIQKLYGFMISDLSGGDSPFPPARKGALDAAAALARVRELEARVEELATYQAIVHQMRPMLREAMALLSAEDSTPRRVKTQRRRRH